VFLLVCFEKALPRLGRDRPTVMGAAVRFRRSLPAVASGSLCAFIGFFVLSAAPAQAATTHEFLPSVSEVLAEGAPPSALVPGPLGGVNALTVDSGHLWAAEHLEPSGSRVDEFDASSGGFLTQLNEEGGVSFLETGVAVGHAGGEERVYVGAGQGEDSVVAVFDPASGKLVHVWTGAGTVNKSFIKNGKGERPGIFRGLAVDDSANLETAGDVYVATAGAEGFEGFASFNIVDVLKPATGGAEPAEATTQLVGTCVTNETACPEEESFKGPSGVAVSGFNGHVLVTDRKKVVDVFEPAPLGEYKVLAPLMGTPTGPGASEVPFGNIVSVAVDGKDGDIYVVDQELNVVDEFNAEGKYLGHLTGTPAGPFTLPLMSVAVDPASQHVFVGDVDELHKTATVDVFGANLVVPDLTTTAATAVRINSEGRVEATLNGTVNPLGEGDAKCHFALGSTPAFGQTIACQPEGLANGNAAVPVEALIDREHAPGTELAPDTTYFFRLQASNENGVNPGEPTDDQEFHTPGPGIHSESVADVAATSATLGATIDPNGAATSFYFEYGKSSAYETQVPAAPGEALGAGAGDVQIAPRHVQGLDPGTVYHYRVVALSTLQVEGTPTVIAFAGPDRTFTTQGAGGSSVALPDGRLWELVSPVDKHGALLHPISESGLAQASDAGGAMTYVASLPTEEHVKGYVFNRVQVISTRGPGSWSSQNVSLPQKAATGLPPPEYKFFSEDLSAGLVEPFGRSQAEFTSLAPEAFPPDTQLTPYVRHDSTCAAAPSTCFEPLLTSAPGYEDAAPNLQAGFVGASGDLSHVILAANQQLLEWSAHRAPRERLQPVSVLPGGGEAAKAAQLGDQNTDARHAVSEDGSRIVWSEASGHLYLRDMGKGQTVQLDVPEAQCVAKNECEQKSGDAPSFQIASADGSRVLFTDSQQLTANAGRTPGKRALYECQIEEEAGKLQCKLTDLTPAPGLGKAADVLGTVTGASEDATWVYFVANGVLGDGAERGAVRGNCNTADATGECNLYVAHAGQTHLIAGLSGEDNPDWGHRGPLHALAARVSPDGRHLAFMSNRSLTDYDNHDALSGKADEEVFLYQAEAGGAGSLACASCNPSGARPRGVEYAGMGSLSAGDRVWEPEAWLAANIPGLTPYALTHALYQSRYLSDSGRLFFNSNDALVPQDINNNQDVYEFEPSGVGDCTSASAGFQTASGGCVALISSGRAAGESAFLDASETGSDVFFLTAERLASKDLDTSIDVYDAHVCSTGAPCLSEPTPPPACVTADACRNAPTPQPDSFGSPASATFSGQGNLGPPPAAPPRKLTKAQQLAKALGACRKKYKKQRKRRAGCERQARKRYAVKQSRRTNPTRRSMG
jgi:WD40-like Beta Propeller Repeat